jgi:uncharacterized protein (DUF1499 family)
VETGRTPEYPDLHPVDYRLGVEPVAKAAREAIARLPRWSVVGSGSGVGGAEIRATRSTRLGFVDDITIRVHRMGERTQVTVRSKSRLGYLDFGQNARNIREFLEQLDREMFAAR